MPRSGSHRHGVSVPSAWRRRHDIPTQLSNRNLCGISSPRRLLHVDEPGPCRDLGRIVMEYRFLRPGGDVTIFQRSYQTETYAGSVLPDVYFTSMNPVHAEIWVASSWSIGSFGLAATSRYSNAAIKPKLMRDQFSPTSTSRR